MRYGRTGIEIVKLYTNLKTIRDRERERARERERERARERDI